MRKILSESVQKIDFLIWWITLLFFVLSAFFMWWNIYEAFSWASWIIILMFLVWFSIEIILDVLKNVKWIWMITWFITNWPEALVLIVWLIKWNILFAASTPLWSNVMNPILLFVALLTSWWLLLLKHFKHKIFFVFSFIITAILAILFFQIPDNYYLLWILFSLFITLYLFTRKFSHEEIIESENNLWKQYLLMWVIILLISWYFLDPVVTFTSEASKAPKWVIWFVVLATLTSWPEFKSILALIKRKKILDWFINILVSNITNLWLAIIWVLVWMFIK